MKITELKEGFLDNIMSKITSMAGGDGITGFLRSLAGGNARLDLVIDKIAGSAEQMLKQSGQTNLDQPGAEIPVEKIILAVFTVASKISQSPGSTISAIDRNGLVAHLKKHQADILRGANAQAQEIGNAPAVLKLVMDFAAKQKLEPLPNMDVNRHINAVSTLAALTLLDYEFRAMTSSNDATDDFQFEPAQEQEFFDKGEQINSAIFTPGSDLHSALGANERFGDNLAKMLTYDIGLELKNKYRVMPLDQLKSSIGKPMLSKNEVQAAFLGHLGSNISTKSAEWKAEVNQFVEQQTSNLNAFLDYWKQLAVAEREAGNEDSEAAWQMFRIWLDKAVRLVDTIADTKPTKPDPKAGETPAGGEIPPAGEKPKITIGGQEIKPDDPAYNRILDLMK